MPKGKKKKGKKGKPKPMYRGVVPLLLLALLAVSGCAGSLGWSQATALPRGSYREERIDRVGPTGMDCGGGFTREVPTGYTLVPTTQASPCQ